MESGPGGDAALGLDDSIFPEVEREPASGGDAALGLDASIFPEVEREPRVETDDSLAERDRSRDPAEGPEHRDGVCARGVQD